LPNTNINQPSLAIITMPFCPACSSLLQLNPGAYLAHVNNVELHVDF